MDPSVTTHQIPGGMLSNLLFQLEQQGAGDKYNEVLEEIPRVREDMGYPPLVTPTSQIVGIQAVMNVLFGRYRKIPKETKDYVRGMYGKPPGEISEKIYEKILGPNWKDEIIDVRPSDLLEPEFDKRKEELEEMGLLNKPEDVLTYAIYPQIGLKFLKGEIRAEPLPSADVIKRPSFPASYKIDIDGVEYEVKVKSSDTIEVNGTPHSVRIEGEKVEKAAETKKFESSGTGEVVKISSPMLGVIVKVKVREGDKVRKGDVIAVLEAMKMENEISAPADGVIKSINVKEGQDVEAGKLIAVIET